LAFRAPGFDYTLYNMGTKSDTSPDLYLSLYMKLVSENYGGYNKIFTDSSKQGICVAAAAVVVSHDKVLVKRLPNHASIFSADAIAILLASDGSISGFQFRYDNDTIFTKYRDIDTILIYRYRSRYIDNSIYNDMK
jgi:hypothetical protein